jgi:hypothetical protein
VRGNELRPSAAALAVVNRARVSCINCVAQPIRDFDRDPRAYTGTQAAVTVRMAAVFALVFLFVLAAGGALVATMFDGASLGTIFALTTFLALAWGVFIGLYRMMQGWENETPH